MTLAFHLVIFLRFILLHQPLAAHHFTNVHWPNKFTSSNVLVMRSFWMSPDVFTATFVVR